MAKNSITIANLPSDVDLGSFFDTFFGITGPPVIARLLRDGKNMKAVLMFETGEPFFLASFYNGATLHGQEIAVRQTTEHELESAFTDKSSKDIVVNITPKKKLTASADGAKLKAEPKPASPSASVSSLVTPTTSTSPVPLPAPTPSSASPAPVTTTITSAASNSFEKADLLAMQTEMRTKGEYKPVQINQRNMIYKMLARYKGEFTVFRELIQNADDANATKVEINIFRDDANIIKRISVSNNGAVFTESDWNRITKIASGNPNEYAVGCFGVGFYSVFSLTDSPAVRSGSKGLLIFWEGETLQCGFKEVEGPPSEWTSFIFALKDDQNQPRVYTEEFQVFLSQTLLFLRKVRTVRVIETRHNTQNLICEINRQQTVEDVNKKLGFSDSPKKLFKISSISTERMELRIELPNARKSTFAFRVLQMPLEVTVPADIAMPIERIMQKKLPKQTSVSLLFELDDVDPTSVVARSLSPYPDKGKLFIGSSTDQSTGCGFHLAAQLIPTIEREQLDFSDPNIRQWNAELITLAAIACRFLYKSVSETASSAATAEVGGQLPKMIASLSFRKIPHVADCLQRGFFCIKSWPVKIPSTKGILSSKECYLPRGGMEQLVQLPVVPLPLLSVCERLTPENNFFRVLLQQDLVSELAPEVFMNDLQLRPRSLADAITVLKWSVGDFRLPKQSKEKQNIAPTDVYSRLSLLSQDGGGAQPVRLADLSMYTPLEFQLQVPYSAHPKSVPYALSMSFTDDDLQKIFSLTPVTILHVCQYVLNSTFGRTALCSGEAAALMFLSLLSQKWSKLQQKSQEETVKILRTLKCMPTRFKDMRLPTETFLRSVLYPENLPHISEDANNSISPLLLKALGVKEKAPLALIFEHIRNASGGNLKLLLDLLVESEKEFTEEDWAFLKKEPFLPIKRNAAAATATSAATPVSIVAGQLYLPNAALEALGLPMLDLPATSVSLSLERLLTLMGVQKHPGLEVLTGLMTAKGSTDEKREAAIMYMLNNIERYKNDYVALLKAGSIPPILPTNKGVRAPANCFSAPIANALLLEYLDVAILHPALAPHRAQLGVSEHPPAMPIFDKILRRQPPLTPELARVLFEYIADHHLSKLDTATFRTVPFIPGNQSAQTGASKPRYLTPTQCLLPPSNVELAKTYKGLFEFIDFGAKANLFLRSVGVSDMPTPNQVANALIDHYAKYFVDAGHEIYLSILKQLAENISQIEPGILQRMAQVPLCLCYEMVGEDKQNAILKHASEIYLVDNILYQRLFNPIIAPDVNVVSSLYERLGSRWLSSKVQEKVTQKGTPTRTALTDNFERLISERKNLILFDSRSKLERKNLRPEAKDVLNKLKFKQVPQIFSTLSLDRKQITTSGTICVDNSSAGLVFNVTADVRIDEIAAYLAQYLLKPVDSDAELAISMLLSYDLDVLRKKGYPVDRLCATAKPTDEKKREVILMKPVDEKSSQSSTTSSASTPSAVAATSATPSASAKPNVPTASSQQPPPSSLTSASKPSAPVHSHAPGSQLPSSLREGADPSQLGDVAKRMGLGGLSNGGGGSGVLSGRGNVAGSFGRSMSLAREALSRGASGKPLDKLQSPESIAAIEKQCEVRSDSNLKRDGEIGGLPFYEDPAIGSWRSQMPHLSPMAASFAQLLSTLATIYSIPLASLRIFVELKERIAFNMGGQLFFNLCAFGEEADMQSLERVHTWTYWYMVMAHEIAHNVILEHGATHENVMRSICIFSFPTFLHHLTAKFDSAALSAAISQNHAIMTPPSSAPPASSSSVTGKSIYPEEVVAQIMEMGYSRERVLTALQLASGERETAIAILMSEADMRDKQQSQKGSCYQQ